MQRYVERLVLRAGMTMGRARVAMKTIVDQLKALNFWLATEQICIQISFLPQYSATVQKKAQKCSPQTYAPKPDSFTAATSPNKTKGNPKVDKISSFSLLVSFKTLRVVLPRMTTTETTNPNNNSQLYEVMMCCLRQKEQSKKQPKMPNNWQQGNPQSIGLITSKWNDPMPYCVHMMRKLGTMMSKTSAQKVISRLSAWMSLINCNPTSMLEIASHP